MANKPRPLPNELVVFPSSGARLVPRKAEGSAPRLEEAAELAAALAEQIANQRQHDSLSWRQVGDAAGIHLTTVRSITHGEAWPDFLSLFGLTQWLGLELLPELQRTRARQGSARRHR